MIFPWKSSISRDCPDTDSGFMSGLMEVGIPRPTVTWSEPALVQVMPPPSVESAPRTFATCDGASTSLEEVAPGVTSRWKSAKKTVLMGSKEKC